jgi:TfoX/Sxy family transcriptional regulator of competence genes
VTTKKENMIQATLSDSNYSDAKSLLERDDERAADFAAADMKKKKRKKKRKLIYSYAN